MKELERKIRPLLSPVSGGYLRPWMTSSMHPERCKVWVVGANPATTFPISRIESLESYIDALFNRNGRSIRALFDEIKGGKPGPANRNLSKVKEALESLGIHDVLQTNINCYPTRMSADLSAPSNGEGRARGAALFKTLLETVKPEVIWLHGAGTLKKFHKLYEPRLPRRLTDGEIFRTQEIEGRLYVLTACLAPPAFNLWHRQFEGVLIKASEAIAARF
ncbi:MAG: hypothetical protein KUG65_11890 [Sphingomonadaceae bacterium]|nr:hypothetical protein [Sphingomonadaceae bacterium]